MTRTITATLASLLLLAAQLGAAQSEDSELEREWKLISDRNGIQVYSRHTDNSRLKTFKGVTRIRQDDEYSAIALLNDYESYPKWLHLIDSATELQRNGPMLRYLRFTTQLPWPLTDREAVVKTRVVQVINEDEESLTAYISNQADLIERNDKYIRFPEIEGFIKATRLDNDEAEVVYQIVLDPGGYIPAWLVNILMRDAPYFTLEKLRRILVQPQYLNTYYDWVDLRGPGRPPEAGEAATYIYDNPPEKPMVLGPDSD